MRVSISHGMAGKINIYYEDVAAVNHYIHIMDSTASRFQSRNYDQPPGSFRSFTKEFNFDGSNGRKYYFKYEIVYEWQKRAYDDGTRFEGEGYTIYVIN